MYDVNGSNIGTIWGPALPPNATDFSGMTNEYVGACLQKYDAGQPPYRNASWSTNLDLPCKCQQVFMSNTQSQMTCVVTQTTVCTAIHSVTMRL